MNTVFEASYTELKKIEAERDLLQEALTKIERIGWREGTKFGEWLIECRIIAREALSRIAPDSLGNAP